MTVETLKELIQKESERHDDVLGFKESVIGLIDLFEKDNKINCTISGKDLMRVFGDWKDKEEKPRKTLKERIAEEMEKEKGITPFQQKLYEDVHRIGQSKK